MTISNANNGSAAFIQCQKTLSEWINEGGAYPDEEQVDIPEMTNVEMVHLRIRMIALENLIITLLSEGSDRQLEVAREMATYISPRKGNTQHPLTIKAAEQINDMVNRAEHFRTVSSSR